MKRYKVAFGYLWSFTWPAILANICTPLAGIIDAIMLSRLEVADYLGGIAIGSMIISSLIWLFNFIRLGATGLSAAAYGKNNKRNISLCLYQTIIFAFILSLLVFWYKDYIHNIFFFILNPEGNVLRHAQTYFNIRCYALPPIFIYSAIIGWLIGTQRAKYPLYIFVVICITNICCNMIFILVFGMNIDGVAIGSNIADYMGLVVAVIIAIKHVDFLPNYFLLAEIFDFKMFKKLLIINKQLFFRTFCILLVHYFCTYQAIKMGNNILAANSLLFNLVFLVSSSLDGFAHAAEALIGSSLARNNLRKFYLYATMTCFCTVVSSVVISLILFLSKDMIVSLLTSIPEVTYILNMYYAWVIMMPVFACWCYWLDGVFIGALRTDKMQNTQIVAVFFVFFPCWYFSQQLNNHGIWLSYTMFVIARGITLGVEFYKINKQKQWYAALSMVEDRCS